MLDHMGDRKNLSEQEGNLINPFAAAYSRLRVDNRQILAGWCISQEEARTKKENGDTRAEEEQHTEDNLEDLIV